VLETYQQFSEESSTRTNTMNQYPTEWHLDEAALDWLDQLLDHQYSRGIDNQELSAHTRAREMVDLWRAQMGSQRNHVEP
jgi:hypothetical protein